MKTFLEFVSESVAYDTSTFQDDIPKSDDRKVKTYLFGLDFFSDDPSDWDDKRVIDIQDKYSNAVKQAKDIASRKNVKKLYLLGAV